ncbi:TPR domain-containing protein [Plectosphaerella plurivora]|uniref:TPR domain-containing protein n=1 Tax=Plectosphaerella plurivora TaxID=936078 RepID=A0A9P9AFB0_9PEZI|nr:TPR domain-containing protein [Plectosphaerella plurivora]
MAVASPEHPVNALKEDLIADLSDDVEEVDDEVVRHPPQKGDFDLQIGFEEILVDVDPNTSLEYLKRANDLAGKPPPSRTPRDVLIATHVQHVENQRMAGAQKTPRMVKKVTLALSYAPSSKSHTDLAKMPLSDLLVENHHLDNMAIVRTITAPYVGAGSVSIVEDEHGNTEKLAIYNQGDASILTSTPEGSILLIKEPYYKFASENDFMLCVDHPSDVTLLRPGPDDEIIPEAFRRPEEHTDVAGWPSYTRAIELASADDGSLLRGLYAKRAGTNLSIKCYDEAIADALASRGGAADGRAYFVAARAAYELADFKQSKKYFEAAVEAGASAANVLREQRRCLARVEEEETGNHDWPTIAKKVTSKNIHLDLGTYNQKTEVRDSPHHGRGLFATRDIKAGEVIYAEKATCVPNEFNPDHNSAAAYAQLVELCRNNPSVHDKVLDLYGGTYKRSGHEGSLVDGRQVLDVYLLESIRRKNCFSGTHVSADASRPGWNMWKHGMSRGVWVYSAYSNHACMPNSNRSFVGDMLISVAMVDIKAGTEVTQIYMPPKAAFLKRLDQYRSSWGFACGCDLCKGEAASPRSQHERRFEVLGEIESLLRRKGMNPRSHQTDASIRVVEKLAARLEALHEPEVYEQLPRLTLIWPSMWILQAWYTRRKWKKVVHWALQVLRNFGCVMPLRGADGVDEGDRSVLWAYRDQNAVVTFETTQALKLLEHAWNELAKPDMAKQARAAGMTSLKIMSGFSTEETYNAFL